MYKKSLLYTRLTYSTAAHYNVILFWSALISVHDTVLTALLAGIPVEEKSSECLICMKYRIIIVIIIISLGHICYRVLQTHHACTHARVHTLTCAHARANTRAHTRAHTKPSPPSPSAAQAIAIHRRSRDRQLRWHS